MRVQRRRRGKSDSWGWGVSLKSKRRICKTNGAASFQERSRRRSILPASRKQRNVQLLIIPEQDQGNTRGKFEEIAERRNNWKVESKDSGRARTHERVLQGRAAGNSTENHWQLQRTSKSAHRIGAWTARALNGAGRGRRNRRRKVKISEFIIIMLCH